MTAFQHNYLMKAFDNDQEVTRVIFDTFKGSRTWCRHIERRIMTRRMRGRWKR